MNKTIEALLRGYILFRVNGRYFLSYERAHRAAHPIWTKTGIRMEGLHLLKGWCCFYWMGFCEVDWE